MAGNQHARAQEIAAWRRKIEEAWPRVRLRRLDPPLAEITAGNALSIRIAAFLDNLAPDDVLVECLVGTESESGEFIKHDTHVFTPGALDPTTRETEFRLDLKPRLPGLQYYRIRVIPFHPCLSNRFEAGLMLWL
jgi:starch phosphorylase